MPSGGGSELYERIVHLVRDIITVVGADGRVRFVNDGGGDRPDEEGSSPAVGRPAISYVHPDDQALALERRAYLLGGAGRTTTTVLRVRVDDGDWRHVETHGVNLLDDPHVQGLLYITRDVEDRARAETSLLHALRAQRAVAELGVRALRSPDAEAVVQEGLGLARSILGTAYSTLLMLDGERQLRVRLQRGPDPLPVRHAWSAGADSLTALTLAQHAPAVVEDVARQERFRLTPEQVEQGVVAEVAVVLEGPDSPLGVLTTSATEPRHFSPGDVQFLQGVANVLAGALQREQRERSAVLQALHDPLTGLPARTLFTDRLAHALARSRRSGGTVAVLLVDLDRFKAVNDAFGHAAGDAVLRALGPRLAACARASDTVARYGGDEFVVLCEEDASPLHVERVADAIRMACADPVPLADGQAVRLSASVGAAWSDRDGTDADALLAAADAAMYRAKRNGSEEDQAQED